MTLQNSTANGNGEGSSSSTSITSNQPPPPPSSSTGGGVVATSRKLHKVAFTVNCPTNPGETVCVVGNCPQLGNWKHENAYALQRSPEFESADYPETWHCTLSLPAYQKDIKFRYFVCMILDIPPPPSTTATSPVHLPPGDLGTGPTPGRCVVVRRWETNIQPRLLPKLNESTSTGEAYHFGVIDQFGRYNGDGQENIEHGWLTTETLVQFKISNNPIQFWRKRYKNTPVRLRMVSVNLARGASLSEIPDGMDYQDSSSACEEPIPGWPIVEVAVLNEDEHQLTLQQQFGRRYVPGEIMIFQAQVIQPHTVAYMIDFYADNNEDIPQHIGFCHVLPSNLKDSVGMLSVPITSVRQEPLGQLTIEYIVVKPLRNVNCDMKVSYSRYWKHQWKGLDIGHRGAGNSARNYQSCANIRENTIASLQKAAEHGADFVEFDVQLSKDLVPVLFHDFYVNIGLHQKAKKGGELTTLKIPVKDLTLRQLHELKVHLVDMLIQNRERLSDSGRAAAAAIRHQQSNQQQHQPYHNSDDDDDDEDNAVGGNNDKVYHEHDDITTEEDHPHDDHDPFPTLELALLTMPQHVGFNVEIKWTMQLKDGSWELENPFELNMYLDIVLETVLKFADQRRVVFSCFHPDICSMVRVKQNKYPVLFLTQGVTSKYPEYSDPRTLNIPIAINYAKFAGILGLSVHTEDILRDPSQVKEITRNGLVAFCWGDDNNSAATIKYLKELGMDGIIFDRIDDTIEAKTSVFFVEHQEELLQLAVTSPEAEFVDMEEEQEDDRDSGRSSSGGGAGEREGEGQVISFCQAVSPGKTQEIEGASLFPNISKTLNQLGSVKECGV